MSDLPKGQAEGELDPKTLEAIKKGLEDAKAGRVIRGESFAGDAEDDEPTDSDE
jgi:predicted transcriptional regulator